MPLTEQQLEDYNAQIAALRKKMETCAKDIMSLKKAENEAQGDQSLVNRFLAKLNRASDSLNAYIDAWDRIALIHIKIGKSDAFPSQKDTAWREKILDEFDTAKAFEISLKSETSTKCNHTLNETKASLQLLERIKLPNFDGNIRNWSKYRDIFASMVDNDQNLGPVTKLYLLRDSLSGEALSVVNKFDITEVNYPLAWKALIDTYENPRVLAATYLEQIFSFRMQSKAGLPELQRFLTDVADSVSAFQALKLEAAADKILALAMLRTFDTQTRRKFELAQVGADFPTCDDIVKFVRNQCQAIKLSDSSQPTSDPQVLRSTPQVVRDPNRYPKRSHTKYQSRAFVAATQNTPPQPNNKIQKYYHDVRHSPVKSSDVASKTTRTITDQCTCPFCRHKHILARCPTFHGMSLDERQNFVDKWKGCSNCLNAEHKTQDCRSRFSCRFCQKRHHSLLHRVPTSINSNQENAKAIENSTVCGHAGLQETSKQDISVILGTARAIVKGPDGREHHARLLLDCGSHQTFITRKLAEESHLKICKAQSQISGLGGSTVAVTEGITQITILSQTGRNRVKATAAVLSGEITSPLPQQPIPQRVYDQFKYLKLADPLFSKPQKVDILIGADVFDQIVTGPFEKPHQDMPSILPTIFGAVIMGSYRTSQPATTSSLFCQPFQALSKQLEAFWKLEEPCSEPHRSPEDLFCEQHYRETHSRSPTGRYMVRLPFATNPSFLGTNRAQAKRRFASLEMKLGLSNQISTDYRSFMKEYEELGHMQLASTPSAYVIPHFGIMQRKLRVVFDASCKSETTSLNELLLPGPPLQTDIREVLTLFRLFPIAITTDIVKMYRQILLHPDDRQFQHIFWREHPSQPLTEYELTTVTYGLTSSPFHALRTIIQLTTDEGPHFPLAVERLRRRIFVDDIVTGADTEDEATQLCNQLVQLFQRGGFTLSKWSSNVPSILPVGCTPSESPMSLQPDNSLTVKVLGLVWNPGEDTFSFTITHESAVNSSTKRTILSFISRIFDPLGFLAPVIFLAKIFLKKLWRNKLDWDENLPEHLHKQWSNFVTDWRDLTNVRIPRYTHSRQVPCRLIGFCDASEQGYAAVLYLAVEITFGSNMIHIITAKTKISPTKFVSIARLELCGAFLLAKLLSTVDLPDVNIKEKVLFTDSTVALAWIRTPSHLLNVFEANRVASISELVPDADWRHVRTAENPADIASRGLLPSQINGSDLWWHGPAWLKHSPDHWPKASCQNPVKLSDHQQPLQTCMTSIKKDSCDWMIRFSHLQTLLRVTVRVLRFSRRSAHQFRTHADPIKPAELRQAVSICARVVQKQMWPKGADTPELAPLSPFSDELGVIRVGGRLVNAPISQSAKHQIIIPKASHLARLIVWDIHKTYYHAGPNLTLVILRSQFWIPSAMRFIKGLLSKCVTCFRSRPRVHQAAMAPLPSCRVTPGRVFQQTGVDYAGPITIRDSPRRKSTTSKAYICLFVCMATKALNLEVVSSLTTEAFLATLDRFVSRRGKPDVIFSDNATNFVGAARYLKDLSRLLTKENLSIASHLATQGVEWRFIPPRSPHFGGLWEAGVKSVKALLKSTISIQPFTYEELCTILVRVEGILNSRPLYPVSDSPDSFEPLTPSHFLLLSAPSFLPEENLQDVNINRLSRWQMVQKTVQNIWSRWHREYLNTLQQRSKWRHGRENLKPNDLVVLRENSNPVGRWPLARVEEVHPGRDGVVRVITLRTPTGNVLKRSIHQVALLPDPSST